MARSARNTDGNSQQPENGIGDVDGETVNGPGGTVGAENGLDGGASGNSGVESGQAGTGANPADTANAKPATKKRGRPSNKERAAREGTTSQAGPHLAAGPTGRAKATPRQPSFAPLDVRETARQVQGAYALAATFTKREEFLITQEQSLMIAGELSNVSRYYNMSVDGPVIAVAKLGIVLAMVNLPILAALAKNRVRTEPSSAAPATPTDAVFTDGNGERYQYDLNANMGTTH